MCHVLGQNDLEECIPELFATAETLHAKMKANPDDKTLANATNAFENKLQAFTTTTLSAVDKLQAEANALING